MSSAGILDTLRLRAELAGRRFLGLADLERSLPVGLDLEALEKVWDLIEELEIVVVDEETERPIGHFPRWDPELWRRGRHGEVRGVWSEDDLDALHAQAHGKSPDPEEGRPTEEARSAIDAAEPEDEAEEDEVLSTKAQYLDAVQEWGKLEPEEEARCLERIAEGDTAARETLLQSYLGRVVWHVRRYSKAKTQWEDLVQAGNLGLLEALATYDPAGPSSFRSFADRKIKRELARNMAEESRSIRIPRTVDKEIRKMLREDERMRKAGQVPPTRSELAESLSVAQAEIAYLMSHLRAPLSLEAAAPGTDGLALVETVADRHAASPVEEALDRRVLERLDELLEALSVAHRRVLALRFGLVDGMQRTRKQTSRKTGFSVAEVRRLEEEALASLRSISRVETQL